MKITADTNVLIRAVVRDDEKQAKAADRILRSAEIIAVTLPCLCEFVWVLRRLYKFDGRDIGAAIRALADTENVTLNRPAVEAGLAVLDRRRFRRRTHCLRGKVAPCGDVRLLRQESSDDARSAGIRNKASELNQITPN